MKGRYGTRMTIYGSVLPGAVSLANWAARTNLTPKAKQKLKVVDWMRAPLIRCVPLSRHFPRKSRSEGSVAHTKYFHLSSSLIFPYQSVQILAQIFEFVKGVFFQSCGVMRFAFFICQIIKIWRWCGI